MLMSHVKSRFISFDLDTAHHYFCVLFQRPCCLNSVHGVMPSGSALLMAASSPSSQALMMASCASGTVSDLWKFLQ